MNDLPDPPDGMEEFINHFKFKTELIFGTDGELWGIPSGALKGAKENLTDVAKLRWLLQKLKQESELALFSDDKNRIAEVHGIFPPITHIPREDLSIYIDWMEAMEEYYASYGNNLEDELPRPQAPWEGRG